MSSADGVSLDRVPSRRIVLTYDVSAITDVDESVLDGFARLLLWARRVGVQIELRHARRELVDLLTLVGLADELIVEASEEAEDREELRVDEEVDPGDRAV